MRHCTTSGAGNTFCISPHLQLSNSRDLGLVFTRCRQAASVFVAGCIDELIWLYDIVPFMPSNLESAALCGAVKNKAYKNQRLLIFVFFSVF